MHSISQAVRKQNEVKCNRQRHCFVIFMDSFLKWVDIQYLKDLSAASLANTLRRIFKYISLPTTLVSDNGTNFTSKEFLKYLLDNYVHHVFILPRHHASNRQVECVIQKFKIHLNKMQCSSSMLEIECVIINFCLHHHNTTPSANRSVPSSFVFAKSQNVTFCILY